MSAADRDKADVRRWFPGAARGVYLNAAAASLLPLPVKEAVERALERYTQVGIGAWPHDMEAVGRARELLAALMGAAPADVALVPSTADAVGRLATALDWRSGDEVVLGDIEYPAVVYPWAAMQDRGVRLRWVASKNGCIPAERYLEALTPRTRVLAVSHVQFSSGYRVDLDPLSRACRERDIFLVVDAIQSLGVFPLDLRRTPAGAVVGDGRKWLMAPPAAGYLYVDPAWAERLRPSVVGAFSVREFADHLQYRRHVNPEGVLPLERLLRPGAGRFEAGFYNMPGLAGLVAALELGERIGRHRIGRDVSGLAARLAQGVRRRGWELFGPGDGPQGSGIVAFTPPVPVARVQEALAREGFSVAVRDGRLRASPHVYNTEDEVDAFLEAVDRAAATS